jgi:3-phenylpropionate/trans-cinnamate dioxygenase ferredoxin subunit
VAYVGVLPAAELVEGVPRVVAVGELELGLLLWRNEVFAVRNICPHQYAPVCKGYAMPLIVADRTGQIAVDEDRPVLVCPWHQWEFDVRTGGVVAGERHFRLRTYPARVEAGQVLVDVGRKA